MTPPERVWLSQETFRTVVAATPLISIDLVVRNSAGDVLLGQRTNRPARGSWFVPGGRVLKSESLDEAFRRLSETELSRVFDRAEARMLGVYEHFYSDSIFGEDITSPDTHYIVLGYQLMLPGDQMLAPPVDQHDRYRWWPVETMQFDNSVHANTRAYLDALR